MREIRYLTREIQAEANRITGIAAVFHNPDDPGTQFELRKGYVERIDRKAFDRALAEQDDVVALFNHDTNMVLGRTPNTLRLRKTKQGLEYEIEPSETRLYQDVLTMIKRGDVKGSSFGFHVEDEGWKQEKDGTKVRLIRSVKLLDVSVVVYPAYNSATADVRMFDAKIRQAYINNLYRRARILEIERDNGQ